MTKEEMILKALEARKNAYSPYSNFSVGAALLAENGKIYTGCNIENAAFTPTNCAERTAFFKAVSDGVRHFQSIAIVGGFREKGAWEYCPPCGVCRQVMTEFCFPEKFYIYLGLEDLSFRQYSLKELLPDSFGRGNLL